MSKIVIISAVFPPEPIVSAQISRDLAAVLSLSEDVTVLCPRPTRPHGFSFDVHNDADSFERIVLDSYTCSAYKLGGRLWESHSLGRAAARYIKNNHTHIKTIYLNTWPLFSQYWIIKTAKKYNVPCITHIQDIYPESFTNKLPKPLRAVVNSLLMPVEKFNLRNSKTIIAISENMKNSLLSRKIESDKIEVIYNWQDENDFVGYKDKRQDNRQFTFMYLGNIGPLAGIDFLLNSFALLADSKSRLIIAGEGSMKEILQKQVEKYKNSHIEFWNVPVKKVAEIQSCADVLLLPIKKGGALTSVPSKLSAYMLSSKPVLACADKDSDTARILFESRCGWVNEPEDTAAFISRIKAISGMKKEELTILGNNGYEFAIKNLSRKVNLNKLVQIVNPFA
jgi:glycosyltransferase involved in cell wall biosynthesis